MIKAIRNFKRGIWFLLSFIYIFGFINELRGSKTWKDYKKTWTKKIEEGCNVTPDVAQAMMATFKLIGCILMWVTWPFWLLLDGLSKLGLNIVDVEIPDDWKDELKEKVTNYADIKPFKKARTSRKKQ